MCLTFKKSESYDLFQLSSVTFVVKSSLYQWFEIVINLQGRGPVLFPPAAKCISSSTEKRLFLNHFHPFLSKCPRCRHLTRKISQGSVKMHCKYHPNFQKWFCTFVRVFIQNCFGLELVHRDKRKVAHFFHAEVVVGLRQKRTRWGRGFDTWMLFPSSMIPMLCY